MKVTKDNITEFNGNLKDFISKIGFKNSGNMGVLKKDNGRKALLMWWDDKDKWFMNMLDVDINKLANLPESSFKVAAELEDSLKWQIKMSEYKMYLLKDE